ncbi:MAG TPA: transcription elongation factor GreA [Candidatus Limnocylindrales bacterium]|nr:transcription elongation factor GreA [Candidatus Limnocylindrales bacterium]
MVEPVYLTAEGRDEMAKELNFLVNVRRPELAAKLKEAVSQGDLKENADYHDAKEQQAFVEGRVKYLENLLHSAEIISSGSDDGTVTVGARVTIVEVGEDEEEDYIIVGAAEANPSVGKISNQSPIGMALLGHKAGDKVKVTTPAGEITLKIKRVK